MAFSKPFFVVIGAPRSGTSFFANALADVDHRIKYFEEPNVVWMTGNAYRCDDYLSFEHAKPSVADYIESWFSVKSEGYSYVLEKTPSNCFRIEFIKYIFPNAKFIFLHRDMDEVINSVVKKWLREEDGNSEKVYGVNNHLERQFSLQVEKFFNIRFRDKPAYISLILQEVLFKFFNVKRNYWGPRFPGYKSFLSSSDPIRIARVQWQMCEFYMQRGKDFLSEEDFITVNYSDLINARSEVLSKVLSFMDIRE